MARVPQTASGRARRTSTTRWSPSSCDADTAAARLPYSGTHSGTLLDLPATGRRFEYAGAAFFTVEDGLLASAWVLGDIEGLRRQLGG